MTNEELFTDLKQFITATISQEVAHLATKDDLSRLEHRIDGLEGDIKGLKADIKSLDEKLDTVQDAIADTLTHSAEVINTVQDGTESTLQDHEERLSRLEHRSA